MAEAASKPPMQGRLMKRILSRVLRAAAKELLCRQISGRYQVYSWVLADLTDFHVYSVLLEVTHRAAFLTAASPEPPPPTQPTAQPLAPGHQQSNKLHQPDQLQTRRRRRNRDSSPLSVRYRVLTASAVAFSGGGGGYSRIPVPIRIAAAVSAARNLDDHRLVA